MTNSRVSLQMHVMFGTAEECLPIQGRLMDIVTGELTDAMLAMGCSGIKIGCALDHVHLKFRQHHVRSLAEVMQYVKAHSSTMVSSWSGLEGKFGWQSRYIAWSLDAGVTPRTLDIIRSQAVIHSRLGRLKEEDMLMNWYCRGVEPGLLGEILGWSGV